MEALKQSIREKGKMVVAFSGGVDSTFLLKVAHDVLGDGAVAVTARSCSFPERELREAKAFCEKEHIKHIVVESEELQIEGFSHNPTNRCYLCKKELFTKIWDIAKEYDIPYVAEASNLDDNGDYRPGLMAVAELSVLSPLREAGMNKSMIRELSHGLGLPTWNKQSFACLSSRFVYGEEIIDPERIPRGAASAGCRISSGARADSRERNEHDCPYRDRHGGFCKNVCRRFLPEGQCGMQGDRFYLCDTRSRRIPDGKHERRHPESIILKLHRI